MIKIIKQKNNMIILQELKTNKLAINYLYSYNTCIAKHDLLLNKIELDVNAWDYSTTAGKHRNEFLGETKSETQAKINSGEYKLTNLN